MIKNRKSKGQLQGLIALLVLIVSTMILFIPVFFLGLLKLIPHLKLKLFCTKMVDQIVILWCGVNNKYIDLTQNITWDIEGLDHLNPKNSYFLMANHQSWLDIVIIQYLFNRKIPMVKFFIKDQLKWIPLLGFSWWAMGCPFMKRYSKNYLIKNPHKKGKDLEAARKSIEILKHKPVSIMNFVEGTRFSSDKKILQRSSYQHLLKPKAGGMSFVLSLMGKQFHSLLDITIVYPNEHCTLWDFICNRIEMIKIRVRAIAIPEQFSDSSLTLDEKTQLEFRDWLNEHWRLKDQLIADLRQC